MSTPPERRFNPRGILLIAIALVFIGLSFAIRAHNSPPDVATDWIPTGPELKLLLSFVGVAVLFIFAALLGICCGHLRVMWRLRKAHKTQV